MRERPALARTSTHWVLGLAVAFGLQAVAVAPTPAMEGDLARDTFFAMDPFGFTVGFGVVFAAFAGVYLWCERGWGEHFSYRLGQAHVWLTLLGFALISAPRLLLTFGSGRLEHFNLLNTLPLAGYALVACGLLAFAWVCLRGLWSVLAVSGDAK